MLEIQGHLERVGEVVVRVQPGRNGSVAAWSCWMAAVCTALVLVTGPAAASEVPPENDAGALRTYDQQSLRRVLIPYETYPMRGPVKLMLTWTVSDGGGALMSAIHFANLMNDTATMEALRQDRSTAWTVFGLMLVSGVGAVIGGVLLFEAPGRDEPPSLVQMQVGGILLGSGSLCLALSWIAPFHVSMKQRKASAYYSPEAADAMIEAYNAALREELGLTEDQTLDIDMHTRRSHPQLDLSASLTGVRLAVTF